MDRRFALFAVLVALIFVANQLVFSFLFPPEPAAKKEPAKQVAKADPKAKDAPKADLKAPADDQPPAADDKEKPSADKEQDPDKDQQPAADDAAKAKDAEQQKAEQVEPKEQPPAPPARGTLGSADPESPYRMLVTWNNTGAAIERIELNSPHYRSLDDRSGYLGYLAPLDAPKRAGALVRVVGPGTPASGRLKVGDVITAVGEQRVRTADELLAALAETEPGQTIQLSVTRGAKQVQVSATLAHQPLDLLRAEKDLKAVQVVRSGNHDPLSFLMTLQQVDDRTLAGGDKELGGVDLRSGTWTVEKEEDKEEEKKKEKDEEEKPPRPQHKVTFTRELPKLGLKISKTYELARVPADEITNPIYPAYSLKLSIEIKNIDDDKPHKVAYRLDGPTGLPIEGAWYASKVSRNWGGAGLRDVIAKFNGGALEQVSPSQLDDDDDMHSGWGATASLDYVAVDAQYFSAALIPQKKSPTEILFQSVTPTRAGPIPKEKADIRLMNVSFRLDSTPWDLAANTAKSHEFVVFLGPKRPGLLAQYAAPSPTLSDLVYFGWPVFAVFARILTVVLHFFYSLVSNYGLAIIMLTIVARACMFPIGRKQALGAQKMQELQPEMKRISEKFKNDPEKRTRATQDLFRQHKYNPVGGCLLVFVQTPIFIGLYRALMVDVELRQAPLFTEAIRWASNLAAPDMFWSWTSVMPEFVTSGTGLLGLGPYLNILPLATIGLFIWQQKMFMPPPTDEQSRLQQKMMQYMMIFMGILFFKVASGLCVYFIASSLWGVCERKLLPKAKPQGAAAGAAAAVPVASTTTGGNGAPSGKKRQRGRK